MSNMDPFDEFEFKPLTEGLGFHKKAVNLKDTAPESPLFDDELTDIPGGYPASTDSAPTPKKQTNRFEDVLSALEKAPLQRKSELEFTDVLPREAPTQSPFPKREAFRQPTPAPEVTRPVPTQARDEQNKVGTRRGGADSPAPARRLQPATISIPSAFLDFVIILALALVFLTSLLAVTKVDLNVVMRNLSADVMTQISLGVMFVAVMQMYVVIARSFFGRTLGEWTFDLQIGRDEEQSRQSYPFRVAARSLLVTVTGLFFLPLISAVLRRDLPGSLVGAELYRQV